MIWSRVAIIFMLASSCAAFDLSTAATDRVIIQYADPHATRGNKGLRGLEVVPLNEDDTVEDVLEKLQVGKETQFSI